MSDSVFVRAITATAVVMTTIYFIWLFVLACQRILSGKQRIPSIHPHQSFRLEAQLKSIDSFPAGCFICDHCGRRSYYDMIAVEKDNISKDEQSELQEVLGAACSFEDLYLSPKTVTCMHCQAIFALDDPYARDETFDGECSVE